MCLEQSKRVGSVCTAAGIQMGTDYFQVHGLQRPLPRKKKETESQGDNSSWLK